MYEARQKCLVVDGHFNKTWLACSAMSKLPAPHELLTGWRVEQCGGASWPDLAGGNRRPVLYWRMNDQNIPVVHAVEHLLEAVPVPGPTRRATLQMS